MNQKILRVTVFAVITILLIYCGVRIFTNKNITDTTPKVGFLYKSIDYPFDGSHEDEFAIDSFNNADKTKGIYQIEPGETKNNITTGYVYSWEYNSIKFSVEDEVFKIELSKLDVIKSDHVFQKYQFDSTRIKSTCIIPTH